MRRRQFFHDAEGNARKQEAAYVNDIGLLGQDHSGRSGEQHK